MKSSEDFKKKLDHARKHPIWLKPEDFFHPTAKLIERLRSELVVVRGKLSDIGNIGYKERLEHCEGGISCVISALHSVMTDIQKIEIDREDHEHGASLPFNSRGIGCDNTPGCFVCGGEKSLYSNISGFVASKEDGETITGWFEHGARLDFRAYEPNWIQVKIGACNAHRDNLAFLDRLARRHNRIRQSMIQQAQELKP